MLSYKRVIIYSFLILIAEFIPLISYINFLFLRKEKLSTSVLMPSVRIREIREEQLLALEFNDSAVDSSNLSITSQS